MSGQKKKLKQQVISQMMAKQISVPEAQARMAWIETGMYQVPRLTAAEKAYGKVNRRLMQAEQLITKGKKRALQAGRLMDAAGAPEVAKAAGMPAGTVTGYERYFDSLNPEIRESARAAAERAMVTKWVPP